MIRYQEEVRGAWSHTWLIPEDAVDSIQSAKRRGVPLTSPGFSGLVNDTTLTWRVLLYINSGELYLQLVEGRQGPFAFKIT